MGQPSSSKVTTAHVALHNPCRFLDNCTHRECYFNHPGGALCPQYPQPCGSLGSAGGCPSRHPDIKRTAIPGVTPSPPKPCPFGDNCTRRECYFGHQGGPLCPSFPHKCGSKGSKIGCSSRHPATPPAAPSNAAADSPAKLPVVAGKAKSHSPSANAKDGGNMEKNGKKQPTQSPSPEKTASTSQSAAGFPPVIEPVLRPLGKKEASTRPAMVPVGQVDKAVNTHRIEMQVQNRELTRISSMINGSVQASDQDTQLDVFFNVIERAERIGGSSDEAKYQVKREVFRFRARLPAFAKRLEIEKHLQSPASRFTIVQGQTGSGKSTQIPQYVADLPCFAGKRILYTQPRKLAAVTLANRVAYEFSGGSDKFAFVGRDVGYCVGGQKKLSKKTRIEFITEGVLLEMIARARRPAAKKSDDDGNPFENVGCVILDEAHERSINCDLLMGSLKESHPKWSHVKVVVTSVTIDLDLFSGYFDNAPVVEIQGRMYPVDVEYMPLPTQERGRVADTSRVAAAMVARALDIHAAYGPDEGDILCFLPGQEDVLRAKDAFEASLTKLCAKQLGMRDQLLSVRVHALYGKQDPEEQQLVFEKHKEKTHRPRKVIFSTDVAETSVTIDGVVFVIDSGLKKGMVYDPIRNISSLETYTISRSSAIQRTGRAGRTQPGKCFRLYAAQDFEEMEIGDAAEIFRRPLCLAMLTLFDLGVDPHTFRWIQAPNVDAMQTAQVELRLVGALDDTNRVTPLGRQVAELQMDPKLVRMVAYASHQGLTHVGVDLAAVLSVANIFFWKGGKDVAAKAAAKEKIGQVVNSEAGDVVSMFHAYCDWRDIVEAGATDSLDEDEDEEDATAGEDFSRHLLQMKVAASARRNQALLAQEMDADEKEKTPTTANDGNEDAGDEESVASLEGSDASAESAESEALGTSVSNDRAKPLTRQQKQKCERNARKWCAGRSVNQKALNMARNFASELHKAFHRAKSWNGPDLSYQQLASFADVSNDTVRRIVTAGFFMNASVYKPRGRRGPEYFALHSGAVGSIFSSSALHHKANAQTAPSYPPWIIFDSSIRLSEMTYLSSVTPIDHKWIQEESPAFYKTCVDRQLDLPVELHVWHHLSYELLRNVFGKTSRLVSSWEKRLQCNVTLGFAQSQVTALFAPRNKQQVVTALDERFREEQEALKLETSEETYLGTTRAVITQGFQVQQLLYDDEFSTLNIRSLMDTDAEALRRLVEHRAAQLGYRDRAIDTFSVLSQAGDSGSGGGKVLNATIKFADKEVAKALLERLRGEYNSSGGLIEVTPKRCMAITPEAGRQDFAGRILLAWADASATGGANLHFWTADDANQFIGKAREIAGLGQVVLSAVGLMSERREEQQKHPQAWLPPLVKEMTGGGASYRVVFDREAIAAMPTKTRAALRYCIKIKNGLPLHLDERDLIQLLRPIAVVSARVERGAADASTQPYDSQNEELELMTRFQRMLPLLSFLDGTAVHTDFVDKAARRAGVEVHFLDLHRLEEVYVDAGQSPLWSEMEKPHGQPIRIDLKYSYTTTVHLHLFECFRRPISEVTASAREQGAHYQEIHPDIASHTSATRAVSKMVTLKFKSESLRTLRRIAERLDRTLECEKVGGDLTLLFTFTGRMKVSTWMDEHVRNAARHGSPAFVRWITKTREFWVYGEPAHRRQAIRSLQALSAQIAALDVVDKMVRVDLRKFGSHSGKKSKDKNPAVTKKRFKATAEAIKLWMREQPAVRELFHYSVESSGRVFLSGSNSQVDNLIATWSTKGFALKRRLVDATAEKPDCGVCYMPIDDPSVSLLLCSHAFCLECIQPGVQVSSCLPIVCPAPDCAKPLHVNDVTKIAGAIDGLVETAVFDYVAKHERECVICPKPGCNQILQRQSQVPGKNGGQFIFCDVCARRYCLSCSAATGNAMYQHEEATCEDSQSGKLPETARHIRAIHDKIFNLSCPACKTVFLDFDGCTCVQCGNPTCNTNFCANCLTYHSDSSSTHHHVRGCSKNPCPGCYHVPADMLARVHREMRTAKLIEYFSSSIPSAKIRHAVFKEIVADLRDLQIVLPVHLQGGEAVDLQEQKHVQHIREQLLNLRCSSCRSVFADFDFDTCSALMCALPSCRRSFCAYCLVDCGNDAHQHVSKCEKNPNKPYFFVTEDVFTQVHRARREQLVREYLGEVARNHTQELAQSVHHALENDFRALGMHL